MLKPLANQIFKRRWFFLVFWVSCLVVAGAFLPGLQFSFSLQPLLKGDGEQVESVKEFYQTFPPAEGHAIIAVTWEDPVTVNRLRQSADWVRQIEELPQVKEVYSPTALLDMRFQGFTIDEWARLGGTGDEPLEIGNQPGMETIKGRFISNDLRSLAFHVQKKKGEQPEFFEDLRKLTESWQASSRVIGIEVVIEDMGNFIRGDLIKLLVLQLIAMLIVLPIFFRSFRTALLPVLSAMTGLVIYFAVLSAAGQSIGLIYLAGPVLIVVIGLSDSIHLQQHFDRARADGSGVVDSLVSMFSKVGSACVLTSLTTAIGFLSLYFTGHPEVRNFGLWCAIGVSISFVAVVAFLPIALALLPGKSFRKMRTSRLEYSKLRRFAVPATVVMVAVVSGSAFVRVNSAISQEMPPTTPSVKNLQWFADNFRGATRVEIDLRADLGDPKVFAAVERIQAQLSGMDGIAGSASYTDVVRFMLPPEVIETDDGPHLGLRAMGEIADFPQGLLTKSGDRACIIFYTTDEFGSNQFESFEKRFTELKASFPAGSELKLNGYQQMAYRSVGLITETLFKSFGISLAAITLVLAVALRSPMLALLCLVPNALPIVAAAGFTGWADIPLRMGIVIIFSVGLGLAVDDTIHLVVRYRQLRLADPAGRVHDHLTSSLTTAGHAVLLTSVVLLIGAAAFVGSDFASIRDTGLILGVITVAALLADLFIFPRLIERFDRPKPSPQPSPEPAVSS